MTNTSVKVENTSLLDQAHASIQSGFRFIRANKSFLIAIQALRTTVSAQLKLRFVAIGPSPNLSL